jgi:RNA polymerase sigma factor (sigma-70 family)
MVNGSPGGFVREFHRLLSGGTTAGLTDRELLERFTARRGEAAESAFAALVDRHGPMVLGACQRILRDPAEAQDAYQATFLVLVRKAGSVRVGPSLGPWLYGVSVRVARRARNDVARRRVRERADSEPMDAPANEATRGDDLRDVIDEELRRLPVRYRSAIVLCHLEGLSHEEAARRLSCPVGTVRSRLARGRDLLRPRLIRRGLAPAAAASAANLSARSLRAAVPDDLFASTARAAARLAEGRALTGVVPAGVATQVAGVSRIMSLSKLGTNAAILTATILGAIAISTLAGQSKTDPAKADPPKAGPPPGNAAPLLAQKPASPPAKADDEPPGDLTGKPRNDGPFDAYPPIVLKTVPPTGATDVDPGLIEIRVTFSKEMQDGSWSWVQLSKETFPETKGRPHYEKDKRTCVLPVKLEPGKTYAISVNSQRFANFRDTDDNRAIPYMLLFRTR